MPDIVARATVFLRQNLANQSNIKGELHNVILNEIR
jgi:hypothetical protein